MTQQQARALLLGIERAAADAEQGRPRTAELRRLVDRALELGATSCEHLRAIADGAAP